MTVAIRINAVDRNDQIDEIDEIDEIDQIDVEIGTLILGRSSGA